MGSLLKEYLDVPKQHDEPSDAAESTCKEIACTEKKGLIDAKIQNLKRFLEP